MKKTHIIILALIAVAVGVLITMTADFSNYSDFGTALNAPEQTHQIVGYLSADKEVVYDPQRDPNSFSFYMKDKSGVEKKVVCQKEKPMDFERSEEIVLKGKMDMANDQFVAHDIQLKCPSKYKDQAIQNAKN